jgi:hypothetical protein
MEQSTSLCQFLELPVELRLQIYSDTLIESSAITISTAKLSGAASEVVNRLYGSSRSPFPGIPINHEPVIETRYDSSLLSVTNPAIIPLEAPRRDRAYPSCHPLLLVNKQIHDELKSHFNLMHSRTASIFISYPHGLHIFNTLAPSLIRQARSIHLAGIYTPTSFSPTHRAHLPAGPLSSVPASHNYNGRIIPDSPAQLTDMIKMLFGPSHRHELDKLELRIYYPGDDSYSTVWGDDCSPIVMALRNIYIGDIGITVYRGRYGTGVHLAAKMNTENRRIVSTVWRRLEEGRRGEPACGEWIVDPQWPHWVLEDDTKDADTVLTRTPQQVS